MTDEIIMKQWVKCLDWTERGIGGAVGIYGGSQGIFGKLLQEKVGLSFFALENSQ